MRFPSSADMDDAEEEALTLTRQDLNVVDAGHTSEAKLSRRMSIGTVEGSVRRVASCEQPETVASAANTFFPRTGSAASSHTSRAGSAESWRRVIDSAANRKHVHRLKRSFQMRRPASPALHMWPAVDHEVVASGKRQLLTFELDPTTLPSDVLCHLAMEMFVSAGLPAGVGAESVRRFILAVRASMLDNPYHNFYHVFDVMQTTNALATSTGTMARLDAWERFALLSAALW